MNKAELIEVIAQETHLTKPAAGRVLGAVLATIVRTVIRLEDVQLLGFRSFKVAKRAARTGKNPRTGEAVKIAAAATVPRFTAGAAFKVAVNRMK